MSALGKLVSSAEVTKSGQLEKAIGILTEKANAIAAEIKDYVRDYTDSTLNISARVSSIIETWMRATKMEIADELDLAMFREVVTYMVIKRAFPVEDVSIKAVLFGDDNSPYAEMDEFGDMPETYNFMLCYLGDKFYNDTLYPNGRVFIEGPSLWTDIEKYEFRSKYNPSWKNKNKDK